ncbi:MAG: hypothetical protein HYU64_16840 [Armatimonadetes bacterium]|nr:hypothetical protein [Armatimonadota bacterium]
MSNLTNPVGPTGSQPIFGGQTPVFQPEFTPKAPVQAGAPVLPQDAVSLQSYVPTETEALLNAAQVSMPQSSSTDLRKKAVRPEDLSGPGPAQRALQYLLQGTPQQGNTPPPPDPARLQYPGYDLLPYGAPPPPVSMPGTPGVPTPGQPSGFPPWNPVGQQYGYPPFGGNPSDSGFNDPVVRQLLEKVQREYGPSPGMVPPQMPSGMNPYMSSAAIMPPMFPPDFSMALMMGYGSGFPFMSMPYMFPYMGMPFFPPMMSFMPWHGPWWPMAAGGALGTFGGGAVGAGVGALASKLTGGDPWRGAFYGSGIGAAAGYGIGTTLGLLSYFH